MKTLFKSLPSIFIYLFLSVSVSLSQDSPNFVFIIADDMDTYSLNAYRISEPVELDANNQPYPIDTPNLDRLAAEGMLFHQARIMGSNSGAVCRPSRTCIMTGKNMWERTEGVTAEVTLPGIFNRGVRSGSEDIPYATYRTCKTGNSYPTANAEFTIVNDAMKRGNTDGEGSEWHADHAVEYIDHWQTNHHPNSKPFLIYLGFSHPHDIRNARETPNLTGRYGCLNTETPESIILNTKAPPLPINHLPVDQQLGTPDNYPFHPFDHGHLGVRDEVRVSGFDQFRTEAVVRNEIGRNFACVDWIDQQVGRVLAKLEDPDADGDPSDSVIDNTYIVFTSDHGIAIGRHGLQGKQNLYEHTWRVPYIVRGPGIAAASETDALIYLHDTFPTFCELANLDIPDTIDSNDGQSFKDVLLGKAQSHRNYVHGIYAGGSKPGMRSITDGRFKLIKYDVDNNATQVTQMFDLELNPFELLPEQGVPNSATYPAMARIRARLEAQMMLERRNSADPYQFLGDRTLFRFEEGISGQLATLVQDHFSWDNQGISFGGSYNSDVPNVMDRVTGETNHLSIHLEADDTISIEDDRALDMGSEPFTLEAYVKLESLPSSGNAIPVISKGSDYRFYAGAGTLGNPFNGLSLAIGESVIHSSLTIEDHDWHYISASLDPVSGNLRFLLDEQAENVPTHAIGTTNDEPVILGGETFQGLLDEVSITVGFLDEMELQPVVQPNPPVPFQVTSVTLDTSNSSQFQVTFESDDTRFYTIQKSPSLVPEIWTDLATLIPGAMDQEKTTVENLPRDPEAPNGFFRVSTMD